MPLTIAVVCKQAEAFQCRGLYDAQVPCHLLSFTTTLAQHLISRLTDCIASHQHQRSEWKTASAHIADIKHAVERDATTTEYISKHIDHHVLPAQLGATTNISVRISTRLAEWLLTQTQYERITNICHSIPHSELCTTTTLRLLLDPAFRPDLLTVRLPRRLVRATVA